MLQPLHKEILSFDKKGENSRKKEEKGHPINAAIRISKIKIS